MCGEEKVLSLVQMAKAKENLDPCEAARYYFEAAGELLHCSQEKPHRTEEFIEVAQKMYDRATILRKQEKSTITFLHQPNEKKDGSKNFKDIGGLEQLKDQIRLKIIEPLKQPDLFRYYGKQAGGGILMYGPPGCGKTLIAKATAGEAGVHFIHVKGSDLKSKYVGETEKNIAQLFENARQMQPTIIFFDEFEAIGGDRTDAAPHERNAVAQLLTEMDGVDTKNQQLLVLAATNEPWAIDSALRREGRFGVTLFIPPPDAHTRTEILESIMRSRPTERLQYGLLATMTDNFSGADLKGVCENAVEIALTQSLKTGKRRLITMQDMISSITNTKSVLPQWFAKAQEQVRKRHLQDSFQELFEMVLA